MLGLALAVGLFAFDKFVLDPKRDADLVRETADTILSRERLESYRGESVAVLPFTDMSQLSDQQYLSDGFAEEILNLLAKVPDLRVASRTSTFNLRHENLQAVEIAKRLNVTHILEGSIRMAGDQLRVTVQFIDARTDSHLWSENYDRVFDDIFAIQDDIASEVVQNLQRSLTDFRKEPVESNSEAYKLYLQAIFLFRQVNPSDSDKIIDLLTRAVSIDPNYFQAWFMLGDIYQRQVIWEIAPKEEALRLSRDANRRAAEIRPESAEVYVRMGWMALRWDEDLEQAAIYIQKAIVLTDDPFIKVSIASDLLRQLGRDELLIKLGEYLVEESPVNAHNHWRLGQDYINDGQYRKAIGVLKTALTLSPGIDGGNGYLALALLLDGQYQSALDAAAKESLDEFRLPATSVALHGLGREEESQQVLQAMTTNERITPLVFASVYSMRGDVDLAFHTLSGMSIKTGELDWRVTEDILLKPLYSDPRWQPLVDRVNMESPRPDHILLEVPVPEQWQ
jgi:TolB-like protein